MKAETPIINSVFQFSTKLVIPFFQRSYVWNKTEWERFHQDMTSLIGSTKQYFLGSLILKEMHVEYQEADMGIGTKFMVVDGQQRLTTLSIYLKALHSLLPDATLRAGFNASFFTQDGTMTPVLYHSINDRPAYVNIMQRGVATPITGVYQDNLVTQAYNYFLEELRIYGNLTALRQAIYSHIRFVSIILDNNDDEQQIFDSINSLGVDLTIDELMKNYLYEGQDEQAYARNWRPVFDTQAARVFWGTDDAARRQEKNNETKVINSFFYYYVRIKMWDFRNKFAANDRVEFVKRKNIFSTCKAFHTRFGMSKQDLADDILSYALLYKKYFNREELNNRIPANPCIKRVATIAIATESSIIPYLLYILKNVADQNEQNAIFGYLESFLVRRSLCVSPIECKNYPEFFSETLIGNQLVTCEKLKDYISAIHQAEHHRMPSDGEVKGNTPTKKQEPLHAALLLYLLETKTVSTDTRGFRYYIADRMIPQVTRSSQANWPTPANPDDLTSYKQTICQIGNFMPLVLPDGDQDLIDMAIKEVSATANKPITEKKVQYIAKATNLHNQAVAGALQSWTTQDVENRTRELAKQFLTIW